MTPEIKFEVVSVAEVPRDDVSFIQEDHRPVVLIVDDERVIADTLSMILNTSGFTTMTAYDAESALELAHATQPDLMISDVMMPGMNGVDLAITMTRTFPTCKVLLFSGQAATADLLDQARLSGNHFTLLTKPVHPKDLLRRVSECLTIPAALIQS
jgi:CheY-like chemotaxis protein